MWLNEEASKCFKSISKKRFYGEKIWFCPNSRTFSKSFQNWNYEILSNSQLQLNLEALEVSDIIEPHEKRRRISSGQEVVRSYTELKKGLIDGSSLKWTVKYKTRRSKRLRPAKLDGASIWRSSIWKCTQMRKLNIKWMAKISKQDGHFKSNWTST